MLRLRIFAYHIDSIIHMKDGEANTYHPLEGDNTPRIYISRDNNLYKVGGISVGNCHGAIDEYTKIVQKHTTGIHQDND